MLSVQPQLAKSLFKFDPSTGSLSAVMGQSVRVSAFAALDEASRPQALAPEGAPAAVAQPLLEQVLALTEAAARAEVADELLAARIEQTSQQALAADQRDLAKRLAGAAASLRADADARPAVRAELGQALLSLAGVEPEPLPPSAPVPPPRPAPAGGTGLEDDAEMRDIFIEEAREVVSDAQAALERLADAPDNTGDMTVVRRAFHTLKGSSRMVGLAQFGEAAWSCEQLYNARLAQAPRVDGPLRVFTAEALHYLGDWTEAIAAGRDLGHNAPDVARAADALRLQGVRTAIVPPTPAPQPAPPPPDRVGFASDPSLALPTLDIAEAEPQAPALQHAGLAASPGADGDAAEDDLMLDLPALAGEFAPLHEAATLPVPALVPLALGEPVPADELEAAPAVAGSELGLDPEPEADAPLPALADLIARVPDLPSAADLDLGFPPLPASATADDATLVDVPRASTMDFDLDLGELDDLPAATTLLQARAPSVPPAGEEDWSDLLDLPLDAQAAEATPAPVPTADVEAVEIDLEELQQVFGTEPTVIIAPPAPAVDDADLLLDLSTFSTATPVATERPQPLADLLDFEPPTLVMPTAEPEVQTLILPPREVDTGTPAAVSTAPALADVADVADAAPLADVADHASTADDEQAADALLGLPLPEAAMPAGPAAEAVEPALPVFDVTAPIDPQAFLPPAASAPDGEAQAALVPDFELAEEEQVKVIGPLRISIPLFNIYLNEADELSRRLCTELAEWALENDRHPVQGSSVALAHSLAGNSATVGYADLSALARALEHALERSHTAGHGREGEAQLFNDAADEIRRLLHQFAAGFLRPVDPALMARLATHERLPLQDLAEPAAGSDLDLLWDQPLPAAASAAPPNAPDSDEDIDAVDAVDAELFPIFAEEALELLPQLQGRLRDWTNSPADAEAPAACMRTLHTFKGGARLAGAMRLGEMAHRLETAVEHLAVREPVRVADIEPLLARADAMEVAFAALQLGDASAAAAAGAVATSSTAQPPTPAVPVPPTLALPAEVPAAAADAANDDGLDFDISAAAADTEAADAATPAATTTAVEPQPQPQPLATAAAMASHAALLTPPPVLAIDWARFAPAAAGAQAPAAERVVPAAAAVRVRAGLLDRLVNQAGEVSITRARIDADVKQLQGALVDLTDSLDRMRKQLRDIELHAETQISSRMEAAKAAAQNFDPLEMDRFTRFQELTRFMAESVNDVATLQRGLQRTLQSTEDELAAQARLTRELQDDLLRTRMVEFDNLADRLYRVVRQAAKETGKTVRLDIIGGAIEIDRGVLERMAGPFEHLLRNSVAHGVEAADIRLAAGKDAGGLVTVTVAQSGNEVAVEVADDGAGLDLARIRSLAVSRGVLPADAETSDAELAQIIFKPGFSTADTVTELAGRGVGLDVVRAEVNAMGGRIETSTEAGRGSRFRLLLPLTTAVTQVVMLRCGDAQVAVPTPLIEIVRRVPTAAVDQGYETGRFDYAGESVPFFWLAALLRAGSRGDTSVGRTQTVVVIRSAAQRVAVHVDEVLGNQEVVVKNVGPQLSRLPGLAGVTLLPSGVVALIYNPVALATVYAEAARAQMKAGVLVPALPQQTQAEAGRAPLVMVVDDSLTVRRVTQRLLVREGYRVVTAKDGMDALERLAEERPVCLLSDIEMPRMDGFDLVRNVRADKRLAGLPVVMITSRIAQKHRDYAAELGVQHYLGKPYSEEELLALVAGFAGADIPS
jgi:chemosensory pili system protein ChpA (sensor histidine kinase/response regulator)